LTFRLLFVPSLVLFLIPNLAASRDLFVSVTTVGTQTETSGTNSLTELGELFDDESLLALFGSSYVPGVSAVSAAVDLRGVAAQVGYAENSNVLVISVPSAGFTREFDGDDRDAAEEALQEWLDGNGDQSTTDSQGALTTLLKEFVAASPVDPVAGNPKSLQSRMFDRDLGLGTLSPFMADFPDASEGIPMLWKVDFDFAYYGSGPYDGQSYDFEFAFAWSPTRRLAVVTDLAMTFSVDEGEALSGLGEFGLGLQGRISENWNLAAVTRFGVVGSIDEGAVAGMWSVSLVNHMRFDVGDYQLEMNNMLGAASSIDGIRVEGIELDYDLANGVVKNGLTLSREFSLGGSSRPLRGRFFFVDTVFFGDALWLEHSDELGLGLGLASKEGSRSYDPAAIDLSWVFGSDYDAVRLSLSLRY
jgi:hypothetical protein